MAAKTVEVIIKARDAATRVLKTVETRLSSLTSVARTVARSVAAVTVAIGGAVFALTKAASRGGEILNVQRAFARVTGDSEGALKRLRAQTMGLVSDYELMRGANQALTLGSARTVDQFAELASTAISLGRALGIDAKFALESLNTGIARQSRLYLDNIGIILDVSAAQQRYAASIGKTVGELTEQEKREAFRVGALEAARAKIAEVGAAQRQGSDAAAAFQTGVQNLVDRFSELVAKSPQVAEFFSILEGAVNRLSEKLPGLIEKFSRFGSTIIEMFAPISGEVGRTTGSIRRQAALSADPERFLRARLGVAERDFGGLLRERASIEAEGAVVANPVRAAQIRQRRRELETEIPALAEVVQFIRSQLADLGETIETAATGDGLGGAGDGGGIGGEGDLGLAKVQAKMIGDEVAAALKNIGVGPSGFREPGIIAPDAIEDPFLAAMVRFGERHGETPASIRAPGTAAIGTGLERQAEAFLPAFARDTERELVAPLTAASGAFEEAGATAVATLGAMARAALSGSEQMASAVIGGITQILQSLPGVGGIGGALIGAVGGIIGGLFGRRRREPERVRIAEFEPGAQRQLRESTGPDTVHVIIQSQTTGEIIKQTEYQLRRRTRRDAIERFPVGTGT